MASWRINRNPEFDHPQPHEQGFDYSMGTETTQNRLITTKDFIRNGKALGKVEGYSCQIVAQECMDWLNQKSDDPFFLYVATNLMQKSLHLPNWLKNIKICPKKMLNILQILTIWIVQLGGY